MDTKKLEFGRYNYPDLGRAIDEARGRYETLISTLGEIGSEVLRMRVLERDPDIFPYRYIRGGTHHFIFPAQELVLTDIEGAGEISGTAPYTLTREKSSAEYDADTARALIKVSYDDSGNSARFEVSDLQPREDSEVPAEALEAITAATEPLRISPRIN